MRLEQLEIMKPYDEEIKDMDIKRLFNEYDVASIKMFLIKQEIKERLKESEKD